MVRKMIDVRLHGERGRNHGEARTSMTASDARAERTDRRGREEQIAHVVGADEEMRAARARRAPHVLPETPRTGDRDTSMRANLRARAVAGDSPSPALRPAQRSTSAR
jgi:hypothetical protein